MLDIFDGRAGDDGSRFKISLDTAQRRRNTQDSKACLASSGVRTTKPWPIPDLSSQLNSVLSSFRESKNGTVPSKFLRNFLAHHRAASLRS